MANGNLKGGADKIIKINSDVEGSLAVSEGAWGVSLNRGGCDYEGKPLRVFSNNI